MAAHRFWRLVGFSVRGAGPLELSEARIYENGVVADASATLSATMAPASGALSDLRDGVATGVVSWPYASYSQPGFALVWDFGAGSGVGAFTLQLGAGNSPATFVQDFIAQYSDNGIEWALFQAISGASYPGALTLTAVTSSGDPYYPSNSLQLHCNGVNGSVVFTDSSPIPKTPTVVYGAVQISTAQSKFGGASLMFGAVEDRVIYPNHSDFDASTGDFTLDFWFCPRSSGGSLGSLLMTKATSTGYATAQVQMTNACNVIFRVYTAALNGVLLTSTSSLVLNTFSHIEAVRSGNTLYLFINGVLEVSATVTGALYFNAADPFVIGTFSDTDSRFFTDGYLDEIRFSKGIARHTANFTPPAIESIGLNFLTTSSARFRQQTSLSAQMLPSSTLPDSAAQSHLREMPFFDAYNGGIGTIVGTVKEKNTPANTPLHRRVLLVDEASRIVIRETWSDPITGAFEFRGVKQGVKYSTISYDHLHNYRAVIADNQDAA